MTLNCHCICAGRSHDGSLEFLLFTFSQNESIAGKKSWYKPEEQKTTLQKALSHRDLLCKCKPMNSSSEESVAQVRSHETMVRCILRKKVLVIIYNPLKTILIFLLSCKLLLEEDLLSICQFTRQFRKRKREANN